MLCYLSFAAQLLTLSGNTSTGDKAASHGREPFSESADEVVDFFNYLYTPRARHRVA